MEDIELSSRGEIWSYTIAYQRPPGALVEAPYVVARVRLPEGVLVASLIHDCPPAEVRIGQAVEIAPVKVGEDEDGRDVLAFAFRPVAGPGAAL